MIWSVVLIMAMNFMFGICFAQGVAEYLVLDRLGGEDLGSEEDAAEKEEMTQRMHDYWGSVGTSMLSLFMAGTGGADWGDLASPLWTLGIHYYCIFCFYIAFFIFVLMNSVTSIFVDSVTQYSDKDQHQIIQDQLRNKREYMGKIAALYEALDTDCSGDLSLEEFSAGMNNPEMLAFAASLDIEATDLH